MLHKIRRFFKKFPAPFLVVVLIFTFLIGLPVLAYVGFISKAEGETVLTLDPKQVTSSTVVLEGTMADSSSITSSGFEYGTDTTYGQSIQSDEINNFAYNRLKFGTQGSGDGQFACCANGIAKDGSGNLYITDSGNHRIQKFDSNGNFLATWGSHGSTDGEFNNPYGINIDTDNFVYIADTGNHRIQKFDSNGNFITKWGSSGTGNGQLNGPYDIEFDSNNNIYVADAYNHRIQKFDSNGNFISKFGTQGSGDGQFYYPMSLAIDGSDSVLVSDNYNHRIQKFDSNGNFISKFGTQGSGDGQLYSPAGIIVDENDNILIADSGNHRIQKFDSNGNFITKFGTQGSGDGQYNYPEDLIINNGFLFVLDSSNYRVQRFGSLLSKKVINLNCGTTYNFRAYVTSGSSNSYGENKTFTTLDCPTTVPVVKIDNAKNITRNGAQLNAIFTPEGVTNRGVELGLDTNYGISVKDEAEYKQSLFKRHSSDDLSNNSMVQISDVAINSSGDFFQVDASNHRIIKYSPSSDSYTYWGSSGSNDGLFYNPEAIVCDNEGNVYIADTGNHRIQKFDSNGNFLAKWGSYGFGDGQFSSIIDLAVDKNNNIFVLDRQQRAVQKFDQSGTFISRLSSSGLENGSFYDPVGITVDKFENIYISDRQLNNIQKFDSNGNFILKFGSGGTQPSQFKELASLNIDNYQNLYVLDRYNNRVQQFNDEGGFLDQWGNTGSNEEGALWYPKGMDIDNNGWLYIGNSGYINMYGQSIKVDVSNLACGTTYHYRGFATNNIGPGYSDDQTFTTQDCAIPKNITGQVSSKYVNLDWDDTTSNGNGKYELQFKRSDSNDWQNYNTGNSIYSSNVTVVGLDIETEYNFRIRTVIEYPESYTSDWSDVVTFTTTPITLKHITNCIELQSIAINPLTMEFGDVAADYVLDNDIDCAESANWSWEGMIAPGNGNPGFIGIMDFMNNLPFSGTFDGQGHTISNVYQNSLGMSGIFAAAGYGTIKNLSIDNMYFYGVKIHNDRPSMGMLVNAALNMTIQNVHVKNLNLNGMSNASMYGGLVGIANGITIEDCSVQGNFNINEYNTNGKFSYPEGLTIDTGGNVYVADYGNNRIQKFDSNGNYITKWGSYGQSDGQFRNPTEVAAGPDGNIYVADTYNHRIQKFDSNGNFISKFGTQGSGDGQLDAPLGMAFDVQGNIYVTEMYNNRIQKFDKDGNYISKLGSSGYNAGQFSAPSDLAIDSQGDIYVADTYNNRIQKFNADGTYIMSFGNMGDTVERVNYPTGIAIDSFDNILVANQNSNNIQRYSSAGNYIESIGGWGRETGLFDSPSDVILDDNDNIFVSDTYNNRIQKFDSDFNFVLAWGERAGVSSSGVAVGGLVGMSEFNGGGAASTIRRSYADINMSGVAAHVSVGGLTAMFWGNVHDSYAKGNIEFQIKDPFIGEGSLITAGGLVAHNLGNIDSSYSAVDITINNNVNPLTFAGGLAGLSMSIADPDSLSIKNSFNKGAVSINPGIFPVGGLVGGMMYTNSVPQGNTNSYYDQTAGGQNTCGSFVKQSDLSYTDIGDACTAVNTDGNDPDYFINNHTNPPMDSWDFNTIWNAHASALPDFEDDQNNVPSVSSPGVPKNVSANNISHNSVSLNWQAPISNGNSPITDYIVQYKLTDDTIWHTFNDGSATTTNTVITGLSMGSSYEVRVAAVNAVGQGNFSNPVTLTTLGVPSVPLNFTYSYIGQNYVEVSWDLPVSDGGSDIVDYKLEYKKSSSSQWTVVDDGVSVNNIYSIHNLQNNTEYDFRLAAVNSIGSGPYATITNLLIQSLTPSAPRNISVSPTIWDGDSFVNAVDLNWDEPEFGAPITDYVIQYKRQDATVWATYNDGASTNTSHIIHSDDESLIQEIFLNNKGKQYDFRIAAVNEHGQGAWGGVSMTSGIEISNCAQLNAALHHEVFKGGYTFYLKNDIDCSDSVNWNSGEGWVPVGEYEADMFMGELLGNNHTISDLYINTQSKNEVGMFGATFNSKFENLRFENAYVKNNYQGSGNQLNSTAGMLIGISTGNIEVNNVTIEAQVESKSIGGLLIGGVLTMLDESANVTNISIAGEVKGDMVGSLVGSIDQSDIDNEENAYTDKVSFAAADINSAANVLCGQGMGGIVGGIAANAKISNAHFSGSIHCDEDIENDLMRGGLVGSHNRGKLEIISSSSSGYIEPAEGYNGGLVGISRTSFSYTPGRVLDNPAYAAETRGLQIKKSFSSSTIGSDHTRCMCGGLVGIFDIGTISDSYATGSVSAADGLSIGGLVGVMGFMHSLYDSATKINNSYASGSVTYSQQNEGENDLVSAGGLAGLVYGWSEISQSYATGTVTLHSLSCNNEECGIPFYAFGGLVGQVLAPGSLVSKYTNYDYLAKVSKSYASGNVINTGSTLAGTLSGRGGLVGSLNAQDSIIEDSFASGSIMTDQSLAQGSAGGLVGTMLGFSNRVTGSNSSSTVQGSKKFDNFAANLKDNYVMVTGWGGLVGTMLGDDQLIGSSYATGAVNGYVSGGLVGTASLVTWSETPLKSYIENSYSTSNVTAEFTSIIMLDESEIKMSGAAGGLVGKAGFVDISKTYSTGKALIDDPSEPIPYDNPLVEMISLMYGGGSRGTVGGLIGSAVSSKDGIKTTIKDSFTVSEINEENIPYRGALIGVLIPDISEKAIKIETDIDGSIQNNYFDNSATIVCLNNMSIEFEGENSPPSSVSVLPTNSNGCNRINTNGTQSNYFKNNFSNAPLDSWNFNTIWKTTCNYPTFVHESDCGGTDNNDPADPSDDPTFNNPETPNPVKPQNPRSPGSPSTPDPNNNEQEAISTPLRNRAVPSNTENLQHIQKPERVRGSVIGPLIDLARKVPKAAARVIPFSLLLLLVAIAVLQAYVTWLERQKQKMQIRITERLKATVIARDNFLKLTTHYINTPLATMQSSLELAENNASTPAFKELIERIKVHLKLVSEHTQSFLNGFQSYSEDQQAVVTNLSRVKVSTILRHPLIWVPASTSIILVVLINVVFIWADRYEPTLINFVAQIMTATVGILALIISYYYTQKTAEQKQYIQQLNDIEQINTEQQQSFIEGVYTNFIDDINKLSQYSADFTRFAMLSSFMDGLNRLKDLVIRLGKLYHLTKIVPGVQWKTSLNESFNLVHEEMTNFANKYNVTLKLESSIDVAVNMDEQSLRHVLYAPIKNAIAASSPGSPVKVTVEPRSGFTRVTVSDKGRGIAQDKLAILLQPFGRVSGVEAFNQEGLGLDLYFARVVLEQYGGNIAVSSVLGQGTTVSIDLPLAKSDP